MFTGIVKGLGDVRTVIDTAQGSRSSIAVHGLVPGVYKGMSVAIDGVCLTVVHFEDEIFSFDVIPETLDRTTLRALKAGDRVNIEPPLKMGDDISGHVVQGHVDGTAVITSREVTAEGGVRVRFRITPDWFDGYVVEKGFIAIDGISLTVTDVDRTDSTFGIALIPETLAQTTLGFKAVGDTTNIELDIQMKTIVGAFKHRFLEYDRRLRHLEELLDQ
jgi:riboflavin synthase